MAVLYVANCTKQDHDFLYRLPEDQSIRNKMIRAGAQEKIGSNMDPRTIDHIVHQHERYGMAHAKEAHKRKEFTGLCYSVDTPINIDAIFNVFENNDEALNERAEKMREETGAAIAQGMESGGTLKHAEVEIVEQTEGTPRIAAGIEIANDGVERHRGRGRGRPRKNQN